MVVRGTDPRTIGGSVVVFHRINAGFSPVSGGGWRAGSSRHRLLPLIAGGCVAISMLWAAEPSRAVILADNDADANTSAPDDDPGWNNVGGHGGGSAVYLQDRWVITADHLNPVDTITFRGVPEPVEPGSEIRLTNPEGLGLTKWTDLRMVRLADDPGLPPVTVAREPPPVGAEVTMIGRGRDRDRDLTLWNVSTFGGETVWTETEFPPFDKSGYDWLSVQTMRWGTNIIADDTDVRSSEIDLDHNLFVDVEDVDVISLATGFNELGDIDATDFEAHATRGDSGGGVFYKNQGNWELAAIMFAVTVDKGQPEDTAVFGNFTTSADLSAYRDQIEAILSDPVLQAGDANQDLSFDQFDLIRVAQSAKYLTGQPATWGQGDWNGAPGGTLGQPPAGDGVFDQFDIIAGQQNALYLTGPYAADQPVTPAGSQPPAIIYDAATGELAVDVSDGTQLTSINIDSASAIFSGAPADNLGGSFDVDSDHSIFKTTFGGSFASLSFGDVAMVGLDEALVRADLTVTGSLAGGGALQDVGLVYIAVPEPSTAALLGWALVLAAAGTLPVFHCHCGLHYDER